MADDRRGAHAVTIPGRVTLVERDEVGSTNACAHRLAREGAADWTVVQARLQRSGRGRHGRAWVSPPGNLYLSVVIRPAKDGTQQLSLVTALAVAETVAELAPGETVSLKWPNDVLLAGSKVSGILLEAAGGVVVIGVGINLASAPPGTAYGATWLDRWRAEPARIDHARDLYLARLVHWHDIWDGQGFAPVRRGWLARAHGLGETVLVETGVPPEPAVRGRFAGITEAGCMLLAGCDGRRRTVSAGTVRYPGEISA